MESEKAEVRVDGQEQTSVVQQNQTQTSENDRQRDLDSWSVELGTAGLMDMMQIGLMLIENQRKMKEMQIKTQRKLEEIIKENLK